MKRDGRYYYVRHIPKDLTQHYTIQRLCFSLKTNSDSIAIRYSKSITQRLDDYWFGIRLKNMDVPSVDKVKLDNVINDDTPKISEALELYLKLKGVGKDTNDKNVVFMWSKIKRRYVTNDTFVWTNKIAAKEAHCSKSNVKTIMRKLEKLGAITCIQKGKSGSFTKRANLYRREV